MKIHLNKNCSNVLLEVKNQYKNKDKEQESSDVNNDNTEDNVSNEKEEIDIAIACTFYASRILLVTIENPFIIQALHKINSEYHPPSQKLLSTTLLEKEYKQVSADMKKQIIISNIFYYRFTKLKNKIKQLTNTSLKDIILDKCTLRWDKCIIQQLLLLII